MTFAELTQLALLGTERQSFTAPAPGDPLSTLLAKLDPAQREQAFLSAAALTSLHERAGRLPAGVPVPREMRGQAVPVPDTTVAPGACLPEELSLASPRAASLLRALLEGDHPELFPEWLELAAKSQRLVPPELLPRVLASATVKPELRERSLPVLGRRGLWLAAQNVEWSWVSSAAADENVWQTGEKPARVLFLRQLRRSNPARARELLTATWKEEAPEDRFGFLAELETGLSPNDEAFLESILEDKRKEIRRAAARLLAHLPASALVGRITERARMLLKFTPGETGRLLKLKRAKKAVLEFSLPGECDKGLQRDGIELKPAQGFGEKAWWLVQMLEIVPLSTWAQQWNTTPAEILEASSAGEWKKESFEAWSRAAVLQRNAEWATLLFPVAIQTKRFDKLEGLFAVLAPSDCEAQVTEILRADDAKTRELHGSLMRQCRHAWSAAFSRTILGWMRELTSRPSTDWPFRNELKEIVPRLAPASLREAQTGWKTEAEGWDFWAKGMDPFLAAVQFRADLHAALNAPPQTKT